MTSLTDLQNQLEDIIDEIALKLPGNEAINCHHSLILSMERDIEALKGISEPFIWMAGKDGQTKILILDKYVPFADSLRQTARNIRFKDERPENWRLFVVHGDRFQEINAVTANIIIEAHNSGGVCLDAVFAGKFPLRTPK